MYPARSILDAGGKIAGASDWLVSSPNPFLAIGTAETRSGQQGGVLDATQRVPRETMLYAYTRNAAQVLNQLDEIGSLTPGKRADLILIDRDVLTVPVAELEGAAVVSARRGCIIPALKCRRQSLPSSPNRSRITAAILKAPSIGCWPIASLPASR